MTPFWNNYLVALFYTAKNNLYCNEICFFVRMGVMKAKEKTW